MKSAFFDTNILLYTVDPGGQQVSSPAARTPHYRARNTIKDAAPEPLDQPQRLWTGANRRTSAGT